MTKRIVLIVAILIIFLGSFYVFKINSEKTKKLTFWSIQLKPIYEKQINEIIKWFINRRDWLDIAINELNDTDNYDNIDFIETDEYKENRIYDIYGRKVDNPQQGIYIINGKKIIVSRQQ